MSVKPPTERRLLHKARKLSRVFKDLPGPSVESLGSLGSTPSTQSAATSSASLAIPTTSTANPNTKAGTLPSSLYANSTEHLQLRKKASSRFSLSGENIPPSQRQSLDSSAHKTSRPNLRRSRSLWAKQQGLLEQADQPSSADGAQEFHDRYLRNFGTMSERQHALNVKRARKMTQLFGTEPPAELMHIQDAREGEEDEGSRDSMFLSMGPLRDRANSTSSMRTSENGLESSGAGAAASAPTTTVTGSEVVPDPETPPPFATAFIPGSDDAEEEDSTNHFQERRRRAAKLSRFFGVGFQDITIPEATPALPKMEVDIKVTGPGRRFWNFNDRPKEGDMQEAIQKLRGMKAG
ncbi:Sec7 domain protein [Mycena kentingensis (nom. inval.)]|nr:Sec7 domain protein [Mycena kentingensis (nom. inval.)]